MSLTIRAACSPGEIRVAVLRGDDLIDYAIWRPGAPDGVGDVHRGRILARVPAMAGAFVAIAGAEGFLPDSDGAAGRHEGEGILVRISRAAQGGKGPRLSGRLDATGLAPDGPPALLRRGPGALEIFADAYPGAPILIDDPGVAASCRSFLGTRGHLVTAAWDGVLDTEIAGLAEPAVPLPGGGMLHIEPTRALVAIDVDIGAGTAARQGKAAAQGAANRAMLPELARHIRLRNLSGAILVDFAGLSPRRRTALGPDLEAALRADDLRPRLLGFTALGLAEIVRPRIHPPLHEKLAGPHAAGLAALRAMAAEIAASPGRPLALRASPQVVNALESDAVARQTIADRAGRPLMMRADPAFGPGGWRLEPLER